MLNNAEAFLAALEANEDDEATRLIYADWLEEQGQYEEAQRQRKWTGAKAWLVKLLQEANGEREPNDDDDESWHGYYPLPSFRGLCRMASEALTEMERNGENQAVIECRANEDLRDALQAQSQQFWQNWSVVTGVAIPDGLASRTSFGCAC